MASTEPSRGEIWLVSLGAGRRGEPAKNRPAVVISVDDLLAGMPDELIVIVPLSSSPAHSPLRPEVTTEEGVDERSVAVCRGVRSVSRGRFLRRIGSARPSTIQAVERSLALILGLESSGARE
ncbi:MAG: type II toxin-antitoxin system PemK/MazF family toxin [Solirubrobacteraceae bacterium]